MIEKIKNLSWKQFGGLVLIIIIIIAFGFGGFGGQRQRVVKGSNLRVRVNLTLEEISKGVDKKIKVKRKIKAPGATFKTCSTCNGNGQVTRITSTILGRMQTSATCQSCGGAGQMIDNRPKGADANGLVVAEETVKIPIPPGVVDEMQLKVSGKGNEAPGNGINGDLLVVINEVPHEKLQREGDNLHYELYVSMPDAILGTNKEISTVTGKVRIKIDPGMQSGKILRLRGKGIPNINGYATGDLLVHVNDWTPKTLNKKQKQFFESMKDDEHFDPKPESSDKSFFDRVKDKIKKSKRPLLIFPQGTRVKLHEQPSFKKGVGRIYKALDLPCIPVALNSRV